MKNKKVKQMMLDIELLDKSSMGEMWLAWIDGVCLISGGNFLWLNKRTVSLKANDIGGKAL